MTETTLKPVTPSSSDLPSATLNVLGGFSLRDNNDQPIELKARKSRQLLAYLAIPTGQTRSREQLAALLWSDRQEEQARGSLRTALSGIRRAIGDGALIVEHDTVSLRSGYFDTDYENLKKLSANDTHISKLGDFYAGEFLYGQEHDSELFMDWLRGLRTECSDVALKILEKNADRFVQNSDNASAIDLMRECLSLEPLKEQTHRKIMRLYAANGEKAMALAQFRTCKEVLLHELDAGPDPETQALADSIALRDVSFSEQLRHQATLTPEETASPISLSINPDKDVPSIAVLPFVNMSGDAEQSYFADGITEDIIIDLSDVEALSVAAKSSSEMYRGAAVLEILLPCKSKPLSIDLCCAVMCVAPYSGKDITMSETWLPSLITKTPQEGYELAVKLSRVAVKMTQPDPEIRNELRKVYESDADALIAVSAVVATHYQTVAAANNYWR